MMVFSVCVNDSVHLLYIYISICVELWFIVTFSSPPDFDGYQCRYKTDFRTSIGWYINITSVKGIRFFILNLS